MEPQQDIVQRIRKHSSTSREVTRGPIKATEPVLANQRRYSQVAPRQSPASQSGRRASSGGSARGRASPSSLVSPEPEIQSPKPLSSQSLDNVGLAMRRAIMMQRQDATTDEPDSQMENTKNYENFPRTPPRPPSQPRPKSAKGRPRSGSRPRSHSGVIPHPTSESPPMLPQSPTTFSKYKLLPSISSSRLSTASSTCSSSSAGSQSCDVSSTMRHENLTFENELSNRVETISLSRKKKPPAEPLESDPGRIHLAIKVLDGSRHERWFRLSDTVEDILAFAGSVANETMPENCEVCTNELPRRVFSELSLTLEDIGLASRTVLIIQEI